jgi:hypothetical protein
MKGREMRSVSAAGLTVTDLLMKIHADHIPLDAKLDSADGEPCLVWDDPEGWVWE